MSNPFGYPTGYNNNNDAYYQSKMGTPGESPQAQGSAGGNPYYSSPKPPSLGGNNPGQRHQEQSPFRLNLDTENIKGLTNQEAGVRVDTHRRRGEDWLWSEGEKGPEYQANNFDSYNPYRQIYDAIANGQIAATPGVGKAPPIDSRGIYDDKKYRNAGALKDTIRGLSHEDLTGLASRMPAQQYFQSAYNNLAGAYKNPELAQQMGSNFDAQSMELQNAYGYLLDQLGQNFLL